MKKYISNAAGVAILTLLSQILGYLREMLFAYYLGTSQNVEAFQVAETVPLLFTQVLISAVPLALTPLLVREQAEHKDDLIHNALVGFGVIVVAILLTIWFLPDAFVTIVAPGFTGDKYRITCRLITILSPNVVFLSLAAICNAYLNARQQFILPAAAGLLLNGCLILMQLITKANIYAVAMGSVCGGIIMFLLVFFYCAAKYKLRLKMKNVTVKNMKTVLSAVFPVCIISSFTSLSMILDKYFASQMGDGAVAILSYSYKIINLPVYLLVTSVTKVMLPDITKWMIGNETERLSKTITRILLVCVTVGIISILGIQTAGIWGVRILFGRGAFNENDILATANIMKLYSFGIIGMALNSFFQSISYAKGRYLEPIKILGVQVVIYLVVVLALQQFFEIEAIVSGNVAAISCSALIWLWVIKKNYGISIWRKKK